MSNQTVLLDSQYAVPVGMALPEDFQKADLDKVVRLTNPEEEAKSKRFRKKLQPEMEFSHSEVSEKLTSAIQELVSHTVRMELNGESPLKAYKSTEDLQEDKKKNRGFKQSGVAFHAARKIDSSDEISGVKADTSGKMMTPEERQDFVQAHKDSGKDAKEIASHNKSSEKKLGLKFLTMIMLGLIAFFLLVAYGTKMLTQQVKTVTKKITEAKVEKVENSTGNSGTKVDEKSASEGNSEPIIYNLSEAKKVALEFLNARDHKYASQFIIPFDKSESIVSQYWKIQ